MKILFVTSFYPYPFNAGGKVALYNLLKRLSGYHDITLLSFFNAEGDMHTPLLKDCCKKVITVERKMPRPKYNPVRALMPFTMSYVIKACFEPLIHERLTELLHSEAFDIIFYVFTQSAVYIKSNISTPQVLMEYDILYLKSKTQFNLTPCTSPILKLIRYMEYLKVHRIETKAWKNADAVITVTEVDRLKIKRVNPDVNVKSIAIGVDFEYYKPAHNEEDLKDQILFLGAAQNTLNIDAVRFFLEKIWPIILSKKPEVTFKIVGNGFGNIVDKTRHRNTEETGFTEDIRPYFNSSKVFAVPLLNGSGIRIKILEAMAAGCPIVTTSIGCEGIDLVDGKEAFIRDDAAAFADAILKLLDNPQLRQSFSNNARKKAVEDYAWGSIVEKFNQCLKSVKKKAPPKCVCGSSNYKKVFSGSYNRYGLENYYFEIIKCKNCGLARAFPVPDAARIKKDESLSFGPDIDRMERINCWSRNIVKSAKNYIKSGNLLDMGCFAGKLLEEAEREGFKAYGVELYEKAAEYGKKRGRNIFSGEIYNAHFEDSFFSCIIINHVFEHILDPVRLIKEVNRILKDSGILIINVPAYHSLMRIAMGQNWLAWGPHIHAFFYTRKTIRDIVTKNSSLKPVFIHQKGRLEPSPTKICFKNRLKDFIAAFAKMVNKGEQIEAVFIKK